MFDWKKPTVQMLGRWQPWHSGHLELFKRAHSITGQVCLQIRNVQGVDDNPFSFEQVCENIVQSLSENHFTLDKDYVIMLVPNIVDISYGRGVGYTFTEHNLGDEIHNISATDIRKDMREKGILE
jgi:hypothetical protein